MLKQKFLWMLGILAIAALALGAQEQPQKVIKHVPVKATSPASGEDMYTSYCAVCHGKDGKGNGPAAEALKVPPANLTTLARKNGNRYPSDHVRSAIEVSLRI